MTHNDGPGMRRLRRHPDYQKMVARTLEEQRRALAEVARDRDPSVVPKKRGPQRDDYPPPAPGSKRRRP